MYLERSLERTSREVPGSLTFPFKLVDRSSARLARHKNSSANDVEFSGEPLWKSLECHDPSRRWLLTIPSAPHSYQTTLPMVVDQYTMTTLTCVSMKTEHI